MDNDCMDKNIAVLTKNISTVGQLLKALEQIPSDTQLYPFGSETCKLIYDKNKNIAYLDEHFDFLF